MKSYREKGRKEVTEQRGGEEGRRDGGGGGVWKLRNEDKRGKNNEGGEMFGEEREEKGRK